MAVGEASSGFLSFHQVAPEKELLMRNSEIKKCERYTIIDLAIEYPNLTGDEKYGVISDLSSEELKSEFGKDLAEYEPYLILSTGFQEARQNYIPNERNTERRFTRFMDAFPYEEEVIEKYHPELINEDIIEKIIYKLELEETLCFITETEKKRLIKYYCFKYTYQEIADDEGITAQAIQQSIKKTIKRINKYTNSL